MSGVGKLMKRAQRIQLQMEEIQKNLSERKVEASAGGGAVKVTATCDGKVAAVKIDPEAVNADEMDLLEDMIITGVNSAIEKAKEISDEEMNKVTAGLGIPGLM